MIIGHQYSVNTSSLAALLTGSWRAKPATELPAADVISPIVPQLLYSGTAALIWWRLQSVTPQLGNVLSPFEQAYTYYTVRAAFHEAQAQRVFAFFRAHAIEPVLVKGWTIGRRYPAKGLRPYGDIDLAI